MFPGSKFNKQDTDVDDNSSSDEDSSEDCELHVKIADLFDLARPQTAFTFESILSQINQVFVLRTKRGLLIIFFILMFQFYVFQSSVKKQNKYISPN